MDYLSRDLKIILLILVIIAVFIFLGGLIGNKKKSELKKQYTEIFSQYNLNPKINIKKNEKDMNYTNDTFKFKEGEIDEELIKEVLRKIYNINIFSHVAFVVGENTYTIKEDTDGIFLIRNEQIIYEYNKTKKYDVFIEENKVTVRENIVVNNISRYLDKFFIIEGVCSLDNDYIYSYESQDTTFCLNVTSNEYSNQWYIYANKEAFNELKETLQTKQEIPIKMVCKVKKNNYVENQGNRATLIYATW